jgi:hypothetical protein
MEQAPARLPGPPRLPRSNHGIDVAKLSGIGAFEWLTSSRAPRSLSKSIQLNAVTAELHSVVDKAGGLNGSTQH